MLTFLAWVVLAAPVALAALWVAGEYILQNRGEEGDAFPRPRRALRQNQVSRHCLFPLSSTLAISRKKAL